MVKRDAAYAAAAEVLGDDFDPKAPKSKMIEEALNRLRRCVRY